MKDLQEIKARIIMMNANLSELMKLVFYEEGEPEPDEYPDEQPYIPQVGEMVEVSDTKAFWYKKIFDEYLHGSDMQYMCVAGNPDIDTCNYRNGKEYDTASWRYCRRLNGEIIEFGCDKVKDKAEK